MYSATVVGACWWRCEVLAGIVDESGRSILLLVSLNRLVVLVPLGGLCQSRSAAHFVYISDREVHGSSPLPIPNTALDETTVACLLHCTFCAVKNAVQHFRSTYIDVNDTGECHVPPSSTRKTSRHG